MRRRDFHFDLPAELIAQFPSPARGESRLLCLDGQTGAVEDRMFCDLPDRLAAGDLLVFNDTRVIPARLFGTKQTGGKVEVLVERLAGGNCVVAHVRASKAPKPGSRIRLADGVEAEVRGRRGELFELGFDDPRPVLDILDAIGEVPLPPYITRPAQALDRERYQTVYARKPGAVAAPTAGLHFDDALLQRIGDRGVASACVTLHVGAGTFQPVRVERLDAHRMHREYVEVSAAACRAIEAARARGGRIIAVGTTSVRALESAAQGGGLRPFAGETEIFIYPGYEFRVIDAMITNFHLPESTLLMLVCAFAGLDNVMAAYRHAVTERYRFFSYGDAMFVTNKSNEGRLVPRPSLLPV